MKGTNTMKLIVLTKKWGRNFTGATLATQYLVERWISVMDSIEVYTLECGEYTHYNNLKVNIFSSKKLLIKTLLKAYKNENNRDIVSYSDDHMGYIFSSLSVPYFHTYHGNWPDAKYVNIEFFLKSFYFIPLYKRTIKGAELVFNVSKYMEKFTSRYNQNSVVVHNGIEKKNYSDDIFYNNTILMVGNIDKRKYGYAIKVAEELLLINPKIKIHIYGKLVDKKIVNKLQKLPNVVLKGQHKDIPYKAYKVFMNTSIMENLSISVCESILSDVPVFCFDVGGLPEVVKNGQNGFVIPSFKYDAMAETINDYINQKKSINIDLSNDMIDFDWNYAAKKYLKLFDC